MKFSLIPHGMRRMMNIIRIRECTIYSRYVTIFVRFLGYSFTEHLECQLVYSVPEMFHLGITELHSTMAHYDSIERIMVTLILECGYDSKHLKAYLTIACHELVFVHRQNSTISNKFSTVTVCNSYVTHISPHLWSI